MNFHVMTLFPDMITTVMCESILGRAQASGTIILKCHNIRDYTLDRHTRVDDYPYGGGAGMVMEAEPVWRCYEAVCSEIGHKPRVIHLTPQGRVFNQEMAVDFAHEDDLVFLCGHYEGIDERVLEEIEPEDVSIGDYVLTGGELPAMVVMDAVARHIPGVLHNDDSAIGDSFGNGLLEYPQYTRPEVFHDRSVPEVLLSGHHANVDKWRMEQSIERTKERRPDLYEKWLGENDENTDK
ncbi:MAG: tRNA (guanosine(37)-N1)-methyltransferase TrmD [Eubacterium sp.]|nr:tRNA (guanosine(37)-N1)-methyltransferase TrmD [Eubacterium sp.]